MAKALADGLSLEGAGEALSIGAAGLFLRSLTGNPMDVHLHTSANLRRYLLKLDGLSLRNKLLLLLTWQIGPGDPLDRRPDGARRRSPTWKPSPRCRRGRRRICWTRSRTASTTSRRPTGRRSPISG